MVYKLIRRYTGLLVPLILLAALLPGCAGIAPKEKMTREKVNDKRKAMDLFIEGKVAETNKNFPLAISSYFEALQYESESVEITLALAKAFVSDSKFKSAIYYTKKALQLDPAEPDTWRLLQRLEQREGNTDKAAEALEMYIQLSETVDFMDILRLSWYYFELGQDKKAKELIISKINAGGITSNQLSAAAELFVRRRLSDEAIIIFKSIIEHDSEDIDTWLTLGKLYEDTRRNDEAFALYEKGLEMNPGSVELMISAGNFCLATNNWDCAIQYFEDSLEAGLEEVKIRKTLCALYFYTERDGEAEAVFNSIKSIGEDDAAFYFSLGKSMNYLNRYDEAVEYYKTGFEQNIDDLPDEQLLVSFKGYARALVFLEKHDEAIKLIRDDAAGIISDRESLKTLEASIYLDMERYDDALAIYEWLIATDPENIGYIIALGQIYTSAEQYDKAEETLLGIEKIDPGNFRYLLQLSLMYDLSGQFNKAEKALLKILDEEPDNALALNNLAYMYIEHDEKISKAIDMTVRALEISPGNGAYYDTLGWGYYKKGKYNEAKEQIEKALKWEDINDQGLIHDHYGDILIKLGMEKEAADAYRRAIELGEDVSVIQPKLDKIQK
ncbi:Beta-barrel assembly-enhancing protease [subsurface metagenome]